MDGSRLDAILFDNDGVLVDTERLYFQATREVLATVGVRLREADYVELFLRQARGAWHMAEASGIDRASIDVLRLERDRRYSALIAAGDVVMPGAVSAVRQLAARYRLAIVTSSEPGPFACAHARSGLLPHFELVLTRDGYGRSKPDPEPYLTAVARLAVEPARCLVIEDSERGLSAARAAGLECWIVPSPLTASETFAGAGAILPDLAAVIARLGLAG
jgi:HAD superfamily hydrolase (TIGR01509 family)